MSRREMSLWTLLAALVFAGVAVHFGPIDDNDGYQYVSVAENISRTGHIATSLVHFDVEREHSAIPAPETTFPPGYPAFISLLSSAGMSEERAAEVVSLIGSVLTALFLCKLCFAISGNVNASRLAVCLWIASAYAAAYSRAVASESLFTAATTGAILLLVVSDQALRRDETVPTTLIGAFLLGALSAWIRYAGLFIFCGFLLYALILMVMNIKRRGVVLGAVLAGGSAIAALLLRNIALTSSWRGGNTKAVSNPIVETASIGIRAFIKLLFGNVARIDLRLPILALCAMILLGVLVLTKAKARSHLPRAVGILMGLVCVYSGLMFFAGLHTPINFGTRMFLPVLPLILALLGWFFVWSFESFGLAGYQRTIWVLSIVVFSVCYLVANTRSQSAASASSPALTVRQQLAQPDKQGIPLLRWMESHLDSAETIVAAEGQATGYVLHRPTVSLVEHRFSAVNWSETQVRQTMSEFHARYLVIFPQADPLLAPSEYESPFLSSLVNSQYPPWLQIAEANPHVIVYRKIQ